MAQTPQPRWVDQDTAAKMTGFSVRTLERMRQEGDGIPYVRISKRKIAYDVTEIERWATARTFQSRAAELAGQPLHHAA